MIPPGRFHIPFAHHKQSGVEACTHELAKRPHNSGPRFPRGASPMRPAHAKPNVVARRCSSLGRMAARIKCTSQSCRQAWARNKQGSLPPAAVGRARIAQPGPVTSVPRLNFKYALQARRGRLSLQFHSPFEFTALPRYFILFHLDLCHTQRLLSALPPLLRYMLIVAFRFRNHLMHVCARPL
jgi:hypothetical protein